MSPREDFCTALHFHPTNDSTHVPFQKKKLTSVKFFPTCDSDSVTWGLKDSNSGLDMHGVAGLRATYVAPVTVTVSDNEGNISWPEQPSMQIWTHFEEEEEPLEKKNSVLAIISASYATKGCLVPVRACLASPRCTWREQWGARAILALPGKHAKPRPHGPWGAPARKPNMLSRLLFSLDKA